MWYVRPAYAQSDQSLCYSFEYSMTVKLLTEQHLEFLSLKKGCTGSFESTLVKMPLCWKSHVAAHMKKGTQCKWDSHVRCEAYLLQVFKHASCADPESFVRGGPTLTGFFLLFFCFFSLMRERRIQIPLLAGHQRDASETPFEWRFAGGPMMSQHQMLDK